MSSIWEQTVRREDWPPLAGDIQVQAVVIGGGMAGILTAKELAGRGVHTVVLEAGRLGGGQTGRTTAKITAQHGMIYQGLILHFGKEKARQYALANQRAVERYRGMIEQAGVLCDFQTCPAYLYSRLAAEPLEREEEACRRLGLSVGFTTQTTLPFPVKAALRMEGQALFHPLKFLHWAAEGLTVYEDTPVTAVRGDEVLTPKGKVRAEHIVFAAHYPFVNLPGFYFTRLHQERSYAVALKGTGELDGAYYGVDPGGLSLRPFGSMVLLGGGGHRTGDNRAGGQYQTLEDSAERLWPNCQVAARWSAQDCITLDGVPYIGTFSPTRPRWYVATGFGKWGMTSSMVASELIADQICGKENALAPIFSPRRFSMLAARTMAKEGGQAARGLARAVFAQGEGSLDGLPPGHGGLVSWQGKKVGAYRDEEGQLYLVDPRCPHMGCQLEWNPEERSWDCPCHGSRFDYEGRLLDGPAQTGL